MYITFIFLILTTGLVATEPENLIFEDVFEDLNTCSRTHWYLGKCIARSLRTMKPYLAKGVPTLEIPSFKPYNIEIITMESEDIFTGNMTFKHVKVYGLTEFNVKQVRTFDHITKIELEVEFPQIKAEGGYVIEGTIMDKTIEKRKYNMIGHFTDVKANISIYGEFVWKPDLNDEEYFSVTGVSVKFSVRNINVMLKKLADSNYLSYKKVPFVNQVWKEFGYKMHYNIEFFASNIIEKIAKKIYSTFSIETLMPVYV